MLLMRMMRFFLWEDLHPLWRSSHNSLVSNYLLLIITGFHLQNKDIPVILMNFNCE